MPLVLLIFFLLAAMPACKKNEDDKTVPAAGLSEHPLYSGYRFDNSDDVINIGTQPLYIPTGLITEAMKRDGILKKGLKELGLDIRFFSFFKGHDVNYFLKNGDIDAGIGGDMPAITAAIDSEVIIPSIVQQGFVSIVAKRHMLIKDLKGRRVGYATGSNAHYSLLNVLYSAGLDQDDLELVPMEVDEMPAALVTGKIDAFSAWEPTPFITKKNYPETVVIHRSMSSGYMYFSRALYEKHPEAVRLMLAAKIRAFKWMKSKNENLLTAAGWTRYEGGRLSGKMSLLSAGEIGSLAEKDIFGRFSVPFIPLSDTLEGGRLYSEFTFFKRLGMLPSYAVWEKVSDSFDTGLLNDILDEPAGYLIDEFDYQLDGDDIVR